MVVDYPSFIVDTLIDTIYCPSVPSRLALPLTIRGHESTTFNDLFGHILSDIQVHATQRGFAASLYAHGAGHLVRRCIVNWRAKRADKNFPSSMGATHGTDTALWFWGDGVGLELLKREERIAREWCEGFWTWMSGQCESGWDGSGWEEMGVEQVRYIDRDGVVSVAKDEDWERGARIWQVIRECQRGDGEQ